MKGFLAYPVLLILLFGTPACDSDKGTPTFADYQKGLDAANRGDYATALKEWKPLADQGHADAQTALGQMYMEGLGVTQDYKAAFKWIKLAAEQGNATAQFNLGGMYFQGQDVKLDKIHAFMWIIISASQGFNNAVNNLSIAQKEMTPTQIEKAQQLARECVAKNYKDC